jgi:response regulator RpfG family c-di-GMP phosphodiesterase
MNKRSLRRGAPASALCKTHPVRRPHHMNLPKRRRPAAAEGPAEPLQVLAVDDQQSVLRFLEVSLASANCAVVTASDAEEATDLLATRTFDLVISDIKMPGLTGFDVMRAARSSQPRTPVVLVTGAPSLESAVFGLRYRAYDYLTKPFSAEDLRQIVSRVREEKNQALGNVPAGSDSPDRRRSGLEALSRIGQLAVSSLEGPAFLDEVLAWTMHGLGGDAALVLLSAPEGRLDSRERGDSALCGRMIALSRVCLEKLQAPRESVTLTGTEEPFSALAAVIPGEDGPLGVLCLGRNRGGEFLKDEEEFLLGYARTLALSLKTMSPGGNVEVQLIDTISSFVIALESKDVYLKGHSARVSLYAAEIAKQMPLSPAQIGMAARAAMLHDLGKLVVGDAILQKAGRLTEDEWALMREHPTNAARILKPFRFLSAEAEAVKAHHERFDGTGYPAGLKGEEIPLAARIIAVADAFDAMTSNRPYQMAVPVYVAAKRLLRGAGEQFDPKVTAAFERVPLQRLVEISRLYHKQTDAEEVAASEAALLPPLWKSTALSSVAV